MSAIDDLLGKISGLSGNKNIAFVFDPRQYATAAITCTPSISFIDGEAGDPVEPGQNFSFRYSLSGQMSQAEAELSFFSDATTKSDLLVEMASAINTHYASQGGTAALIAIGHSGGLANFSTLYQLNSICGANGFSGGYQTTLHLLPSTAENDAVLTLFGAGVSVDSCGLDNWPTA